MSKKDYIAIANVIKNIKDKDYSYSKDNVKKEILYDLIDSLIHVFKIDNANFDENKFYGYIKSNKRYKDFTTRQAS